MQTERAQALVSKLKELPPDRIAEVEDFIDFLRARRQAAQRTTSPQARPELDFPVDAAGTWPENLSLRREDLYDDSGR